MLGSVQMLSPGATGRPSLSSARGSARTRKATVVHATYKSSEKTENKPYAADKKAAVALLAGIATTCLVRSPCQSHDPSTSSCFFVFACPEYNASASFKALATLESHLCS